MTLFSKVKEVFTSDGRKNELASANNEVSTKVAELSGDLWDQSATAIPHRPGTPGYSSGFEKPSLDQVLSDDVKTTTIPAKVNSVGEIIDSSAVASSVSVLQNEGIDVSNVAEATKPIEQLFGYSKLVHAILLECSLDAASVPNSTRDGLFVFSNLREYVSGFIKMSCFSALMIGTYGTESFNVWRDRTVTAVVNEVMADEGLVSSLKDKGVAANNLNKYVRKYLLAHFETTPTLVFNLVVLYSDKPMVGINADLSRKLISKARNEFGQYFAWGDIVCKCGTLKSEASGLNRVAINHLGPNEKAMVLRTQLELSRINKNEADEKSRLKTRNLSASVKRQKAAEIAGKYDRLRSKILDCKAGLLYSICKFSTESVPNCGVTLWARNAILGTPGNTFSARMATCNSLGTNVLVPMLDAVQTGRYSQLSVGTLNVIGAVQTIDWPSKQNPENGEVVVDYEIVNPNYVASLIWPKRQGSVLEITF